MRSTKVDWKSKDLGGNMYSVTIGFVKSLKNVAVTVGIPAVVVLINNYVEWMPKSWYTVGVPLISVISYMIKNYIKNK